MSAALLHYRPWRGEFRRPVASVWPIARVALGMIFRRKLFWVLYVLGLFFFLLFFFGQYLLALIPTQTGESRGFEAMMLRALPQLRRMLKLDGTGQMYASYFNLQGNMVMIILALAGAILIGNDVRFGSLPFYLSKPLSRWHYLLGKGLAVAVFINLMTTGPAVLLFIQCGLLDSWDYYLDQFRLLLGILGYGLVLTVSLSLILLAMATWLQRTVPLIMAWTLVFMFCRVLAVTLVEQLHYDPRWRLIDLWYNTSLVGNACLGIDLQAARPDFNPAWAEAALVLLTVCILCLTYLILRIRGVEVVTG
jgi:ABC-type transport system involved in multi-copper enzyme maturation permease subunit